MKKEVLFNAIFIFIFVVLSPLIVSLGLREIPKSDQRSFGGHRKLYGDIVFKTDIIGEENNLLSVGLSFQNYNLLNKKDVTMIIYDGGTEIRRSSVNGGSITDGGFVKFRFVPIADSKGKTYRVEISSKDSSGDDSLQVYFDCTETDLNYQLFYKPDYLSTIIFVYNNWFIKLLSDKLFFSFYLLMILGLGLIIITPKD